MKKSSPQTLKALKTLPKKLETLTNKRKTQSRKDAERKSQEASDLRGDRYQPPVPPAIGLRLGVSGVGNGDRV